MRRPFFADPRPCRCRAPPMKHPAAVASSFCASFLAAVAVPRTFRSSATTSDRHRMEPDHEPPATPLVSSPIVITQGSSPWIKLWFAERRPRRGFGDPHHRRAGRGRAGARRRRPRGLVGHLGVLQRRHGVVELDRRPERHRVARSSRDTTRAARSRGRGHDLRRRPTTACLRPSAASAASSTRSMNALCSGGLVSTNSCYLTAGHCVGERHRLHGRVQLPALDRRRLDRSSRARRTSIR